MICIYVILVSQNCLFKLPKYAKPSSKITLGGNIDGVAKFRGLDL